jgi:hypothetical protein
LRQISVYLVAALFLSSCGSEERDAAVQSVNRHIRNSETTEYGRLYHLKTEGGYDCIDVTFKRATDPSTVHAAALLENHGDNLVFKRFAEGRACEELRG